MSFIDGELIEVIYPPAVDNIKNIKWRTKDGQIIPVSELADTHLRNIALFLMGMGYLKCTLSDEKRTAWLVILRIEWERRINTNKHIMRASDYAHTT